MPKRVDHDQRRNEIVEATWRIVESGGFDAATMREIANNAGFANGALKHYFPNKGAILTAAYERAFDLTNERVKQSVGDQTGIEAIRRFCLEMMPLDKERATESRVVLAFWDSAVSDSTLTDIHQRATREWIDSLHTWVAGGRASGEIVTTMDDTAIVDEFLCLTMGLQVVPLLLADRFTPASQLGMLDALLERLVRA
jgi:AcrR family transcriptional regulator